MEIWNSAQKQTAPTVMNAAGDSVWQESPPRTGSYDRIHLYEKHATTNREDEYEPHLAPLGTPFVVAGATGLLSVAAFAKLDRKPKIDAGECQAAAMIHDVQKNLN
jgi:hypothetical protein